MIPKLNNYIPLPDRILLEQPENKTSTGIILQDKTIIDDSINKGTGLKVLKDFKSNLHGNEIYIKKGDYVSLQNNIQIKSIEFQECKAWQIPISGIAGYFKNEI